MKITLLRHFKVNHPYPKKFWLNRAEVAEWFEGYDGAEIEYAVVDLSGREWKRCYTSPAERTLNTAKHIYQGDLHHVPALRELEILDLFSEKIKLPFLVWAIMIRMSSTRENRITVEFRRKLNEFLDQLMEDGEKDVLIVSHVFPMMHLQKELIRRGFVGERFKIPQNGKLYVWERR